MPIIVRKTVSIFHDAWHALQTSRRAQWLAIATVTGTIIGVIVISNLSGRIRTIESNRQDAESLSRELFNFKPLLGRKDVIVLGADMDSGMPRVSALGNFKASLAETFPKKSFVSDVLLPPFYSDHFRSVFSGDTSSLVRGEYFDHAGPLLLVNLSASFNPSSAGGGMRSCSADAAFRVYRSSDAPAGDAIVHLSGIGSTDDASLRDALSRLPTQRKKLESLFE